MLHNYALLFLLQSVNDMSCDMNVQVQPKIGAVPGGGEAKQYFIVCELFKISCSDLNFFSCSQHVIVLIGLPMASSQCVLFLTRLYFGTTRFQQKNSKLYSICV